MQKNQFSDAPKFVDRPAPPIPNAGSWTRKMAEIAEREEQQSMEDVTMEDTKMKKRKREASDSPGRDGVQGSKEGPHTKAQLSEEMWKADQERDDQEYAWSRFMNKLKHYSITKALHPEEASKNAFDALDEGDQALVKKYHARVLREQ